MRLERQGEELEREFYLLIDLDNEVTTLAERRSYTPFSTHRYKSNPPHFLNLKSMANCLLGLACEEKDWL